MTTERNRMTKIKLCGLTRPCDIQTANELMPEYIGFVFASKSKRYVPPEQAAELRQSLHPGILAVGVFVDEEPQTVAGLLRCGTIDIAQLHGHEDEDYIKTLRTLTDKPIIKAFRIDSEKDVLAAQNSTADYVLADSGSGGTGTMFDWNLLQKLDRPFFLAGGLGYDNIKIALDTFHPYAVDVSSGIETGGYKDPQKMKAFVRAVRKCERR